MSEFLRKYGQKLSSELTPEEIASLEEERNARSFKRRPQDVNGDELSSNALKTIYNEYNSLVNTPITALNSALKGENPISAIMEDKPTEMEEPVREVFKKLDPKIPYSGQQAGSNLEKFVAPVAFAADWMNPLDPLNLIGGGAIKGGVKSAKKSPKILQKLKDKFKGITNLFERKIVDPNDFVAKEIADNPTKMAEVLQGMDLSNIKGVSPDMRYPRINPDAVGAQHLDEATDPLIELKKLLQKK